MPKLRGHHLICLHFFHGEGYDRDFVNNLAALIARVEREGAEVCSGADDVCGRCPQLKGAVCGYAENADEEIAEMDRRALGLLGMARGESAEWKRLREALPGIFREWSGSFCTICGWRRACERDAYFRKLTE